MTVKGSIQGRLESTIEGLEVGEEGFTLPLAVSFEPVENQKYNVYLWTKFPIAKTRGERMQLHIKRINHEAGGYEIDLDSVPTNYRWKIDDISYDNLSGKKAVLVGQVDMF